MCLCPSGGAGPVDGERRPDPGQQRPGLAAAEDSVRTDPLLLHPADLPLHLGEQKDGHHPQGVDRMYYIIMCGFVCGPCSDHFDQTSALSDCNFIHQTFCPLNKVLMVLTLIYFWTMKLWKISFKKATDEYVRLFKSLNQWDRKCCKLSFLIWFRRSQQETSRSTWRELTLPWRASSSITTGWKKR